MSHRKLKVDELDWDGWKSPGGMKYRAAYAANNHSSKEHNHNHGLELVPKIFRKTPLFICFRKTAFALCFVIFSNINEKFHR